MLNVWSLDKKLVKGLNLLLLVLGELKATKNKVWMIKDGLWSKHNMEQEDADAGINKGDGECG